jgi:plastocyanin
MRKIMLLLALVGFSFSAWSQDCSGADHTVYVESFSFTPSSLTVSAGDVIAFVNNGGFHDVNGVSSSLGDTWSNPETFSLGSITGDAIGICMGTVTLNIPGTYNFDCSINGHASQGMVGSIVVEPAASSVTFTVDASQITVEPEGMQLVGAMNDWGGEDMGDNGDGTWSVTKALADGGYEFKFRNGYNGWENVVNRSVTVAGADFAYSACFDTELDMCPSSMVTVTFQVDMANETLAAGDVVRVAGAFNGWSDSANELADADADGVWAADIEVNPGTSSEYKFLINAWGTDETGLGGTDCDAGSGNRGFTVAEADTVLGVTCYNLCGPCPTSTLLYATLDASCSGIADVTSVRIGGPSWAWDPLAGPEAVDQGDGIWLVTLAETPLSNMEYRWQINGSFEDMTANTACSPGTDGGTNNRVWAVGSGDLADTWASCDPCPAPTDSVMVTLRVDMSAEGANPIGVFVTGSFQGWNLGGTQLVDEGAGIFSTSFNALPGDEVSYSFVNGTDWGFQESVPQSCGVSNEFGGFNRSFTTPAEDYVVPTHCFSSCLACGNDLPTVDVTFTVLTSNIDVAAGGMHLAGSMQGWNDSSTQLTDNGDDSWSVTLGLEAGSYEYKFLNGPGGFENLECGGNRSVAVAEGDAPFEQTFCFGQCSESCIVDPEPADITFSLDMSQVIGLEADNVFVTGSFTDPAWQGGGVLMDDSDGDLVFTSTVTVSGAASFEYKFFNGNPFPGGVSTEVGGETGDFETGGCGIANPFGGFNRTHTRTGSAEILATVCWESCADCQPAVDGLGCTDENAGNFDAAATTNDGSCLYNVRIRVDMSNASVSAAGLHVAGDFQGWEPATTAMALIGLNLYELNLQITNGDYAFRYINGDSFDDGESNLSTCGVDDGFGGFNRHLTVADDHLQLELVCFDQCALCAGCTDPFSLEFDPFAGSDDGSCTTPLVEGCTYPMADNYNPAANVDNGSCELSGSSSCPTDVNGDGATSVGDLLLLLGSFGMPCE